MARSRAGRCLLVGGLCLAVAGASLVLAGQGLDFVQAHYDKFEYQIAMRDGVKLHTVILIPKGADGAPILLAIYLLDCGKNNWALAFYAGAVLAKLREEIDEVEAELDAGDAKRVADEVGDLLFAVANLARHLSADPETALRGANAKFERRFAHIESRLSESGRAPADATLDEMEALWGEAKQRERQAP